MSNVALPHSEPAFCTDASLAKGAVRRTRVGSDVSAALWAHAGKKGFYTKLDGHRSGKDLDLEEGPVEDLPPPELLSPKDRPIGLDYDFLEVGRSGLPLVFVPGRSFLPVLLDRCVFPKLPR